MRRRMRTLRRLKMMMLARVQSRSKKRTRKKTKMMTMRMKKTKKSTGQMKIATPVSIFKTTIRRLKWTRCWRTDSR